VCVNHFLFQKQERCTAGPGQGVFLDVTPSENLDYGRIYPNAGVTGSTTVYGVIYYKDPPPPPPPLSWHCCDNLGGNVVGDPEKTVDVVARDSANSVSHWKWNGTTWLSDNLGGNITSDPDMSSWGSQRMDVFARGIDNALWHRYWNNGFWGPWENLGGSLASGPSAVSWGSDRIDVVARAGDDPSSIGGGTARVGRATTSEAASLAIRKSPPGAMGDLTYSAGEATTSPGTGITTFTAAPPGLLGKASVALCTHLRAPYRGTSTGST
jgi:hypothetical protein